VFWVIGGIDPETYDVAVKSGTLDTLPANHAPDFAPVIDPTLRTGIEAMLAAAGVWLVQPLVQPGAIGLASPGQAPGQAAS